MTEDTILLVLYLLVLLIMLLVSVSIIYNTIKLGISPMPSSNKAYRAVIKLIEQSENGPIVDLGSGWGLLVIRLARRYPRRCVIGYELSFLPWLAASIIKYILRLDNLNLYKQDFYKADLGEVSVLICYLFPAAMDQIKTKLQLKEIRTNYLISNNFALSSTKFDVVIYLNDFYKSPVYLYKTKKM